MSNTGFAIEDLKRILREGAGDGEEVSLDKDILDVEFEELGYESLALLETGGRIEREYQISLEDTALAEARTPRALIAIVNRQLGSSAGPVV